MSNKEIILPYLIIVENDPETDQELKQTFGDWEEAERNFAYCRRVYKCRIEWFEQNMNGQIVKTIATYLKE
jgi:hypothetical protein